MLAPDVTILEESLSGVAAYPKAIDAFQAALAKAPLEKKTWHLEGSYGFLNFKDWWADIMVDLRVLAPDLHQALSDALYDSSDLNQGFEELHHWAVASLPAYSRTFDLQSKTIVEAGKMLRQGQATILQRLQVLKAFAVLAEELELNVYGRLRQIAGEIQRDLARLREHHRQLVEDDHFLDYGIAHVKRFFEGETTNKVREYGDDAINQVKKIEQEVLGPLQQVDQALALLQKANEAADHALSSMLGHFNDLAVKYREVQSALEKAGDAELGSALQRLDILIAGKAWRSSANYAARSGL